MATIEKLPIPNMPPPPAYRLELTEDEAGMLQVLLGRCVGGGVTSPIYEAFRKAQVNGHAKFRVAEPLGLNDAIRVECV